MSYTIKLGSFSKHENSTKQPNVTGWAAYDIVFKDGSDLSSPVVTLSEDFDVVKDFNYAYLFERYYFVTDVRAVRSGLCSIYLSIDVLATYKTQIGSTPMYITRAANAYDGTVVDNYFPMLSKYTGHHYTFDNTSYSFSGGYYVVNVMGKNTGSSTLYQMTPSAFSTFLDSLYGLYGNFSWNSVADQVTNGLFKPLENINSVRWYPQKFTSSSAVSTVYVGLWSCPVSAEIISNPVRTYNYSASVAQHPQAATRGSFLNSAPFTETLVDFPPFGIIAVDSTQLIYNNSLGVELKVDALTGMATLRGTITDDRAGSGETYTIFSVAAQWGVELPMKQSSSQGTVSTLINTAATIASAMSGTPAAAIASGVSAIGNAASSIIGTTSSNGSQGTILAHQMPKILMQRFFEVAADDNTNFGRPYCQVTTPSTLEGFMIAQKGLVEVEAPLSEEEHINSLMESGFYYE